MQAANTHNILLARNKDMIQNQVSYPSPHQKSIHIVIIIIDILTALL